jgi:excisionase family DNA binding protein
VIVGIDRQRRHDERWQGEVIDGMARTLDVLHDVSDQLQRIAALLTDALQRNPDERQPATSSSSPALLTIDDLAEHLGVTAIVVRRLTADGRSPATTRIGRRVYFQRADVERWLAGLRSSSDEPGGRVWSDTITPGRIGERLAATSSPAQSWCGGSHTEPLGASAYPGRGKCRVCHDDVLINNNGTLRKHAARAW